MRWFVNAALHLSLVTCLVACGEHTSHTGIDAYLGDTDFPGDDALDGCDYHEQHDSTNDNTVPAPGIAEPTGLTVGTKTTICGIFQSNHYDGSTTVDVDDYAIQIAADSDVVVRLTGAGVGAIEYSGLDIYTATGTTPVGGNTVYGDHGVTGVHLAPGSYSISPFALASQAITADIPYKIELATESLATRCPPNTMPGFGETEVSPNTANNVITFPNGSPPALTASTSDAPETSGITTSATSTNRITGSAADLTTADKYEDKDTFAFATGAANELTVRLSWTGAADLEFFVFEANNASPIWRATGTTAGAENDFFSLKPNSNYWLTVAANPGAGLPATYSATLCGSNY
ncbi:MAG TPA: hypothetical protein VL326_32895 [Kofleriaceae bacterium]|jgi:hypothetical protein|nr:hypothetical protein [Kofleriaceae bacterium]